MKWDPISRRQFLQGAGGLTVTIPFLPSLLSAEALAQASGSPLPRFVFAHSYNGGFHPDALYPQTPLTTQVLSPNNHVIRWGQLVNRTTADISPMLDSKFSAYANRMNILRGLDIADGPLQNPIEGDQPTHIAHHDGAPYLGNFCQHAENGTGSFGASRFSGNHTRRQPTIDYLLSYSKKFYPTLPRVPVANVYSGRCSSWPVNPADPTSDLQRGPRFYSPRELFLAAFSSTTPAQNTEEIRLVDAVYEDFQKLKSNKRINKSDMSRLDSFLTSLSEVEGQLRRGSSCSRSSVDPVAAADNRSHDWDDLLGVHSSMNKVLAAALACGETRLASLVFEFVYTNIKVNMPDGVVHQDAHNYTTPGKTESMRTLQKAFLDHVLELVKILDQYQEWDGQSLLHHSLVMAAWENAHAIHYTTGLPVITFGGFSGQIETGRYIDYTNYDLPLHPVEPAGVKIRQGYLYNAYLSNIVQGLGLSPSDFASYGDPTRGGIGTIHRTDPNAYASSINRLNEPMPLLTKQFKFQK